MKSNKKINPYEKKRVRHRRIDRKQWIVIISLLSVVAIIVGIVVAGNLSRASITDPHAGHNHGTEGADSDPHAGHDHGTEAPDAGVLTHRVYANADNTYRVQVTDDHNKVVFERDKLYRTPVREEVSGDIFSLGWATGVGANDFEHIFCNKKTGAVSAVFYAPRCYDGVRVAYSNADQTAIIVQDIFSKDTYYKEYPLADVYTKGDNVIVSGKMQADKKSVLISYVADEKGGTRQATVNLYE